MGPRESATDLWSNRLVEGVCEFSQSRSEGKRLADITKKLSLDRFLRFNPRECKYSCLRIGVAL